MQRQLAGRWKQIFFCLCIAWMLFQIISASVWNLPDMRLRSLFVAFGFAATFMLIPATKRGNAKGSVPVWDIVFVCLAIAACLNVYFAYYRFNVELGQSTSVDLILAAAITLLSIEAARRTMGWVFPAMVVASMVYAFAGPLVPGLFGHPGLSVTTVLQTVYQGTLGAWGSITGVVAQVVIMFVIFGAFLQYSGGGQIFIDLALKIAGRFTGGPALVGVIASGLFGTLSGSAVANVLSVGNFTIPLMKRVGYDPAFAGGVEATASSGGIIMPPVMGSGAFIMSELLNIPYVTIAVAAIIPAVLFYVACLVSVRLEALKLKLPPVDKREIKPWGEILKVQRLAPLVVPAGVLVYTLLSGYSAQVSALYAWVAGVVLFLATKPTFAGVKERGGIIIKTMQGSAVTMLGLVGLIVAANIFLSLIGATGAAVKFTSLLTEVSFAGTFGVLLIGAILVIILGFPMPAVAAYLIAAAVVAPALVKLGLPVLPVHLFLLYCSVIAGITPPVAPASYSAAIIAGAPPLKTCWWAMRLSCVIFIIPFVFVYHPELVLMGQPATIALSFIRGLAAAVLLGSSTVGYVAGKISIPSRIITFVGGVLLMVTSWQISLLTLVVVVGTIVGEKLLRRPAEALQRN